MVKFVKVKRLVRRLQNEEEDVRRQAAGTLGAMQAIAAIEPLIETLKDEEISVRNAAREALGSMGEPAARRLIQILKDESSDIRILAAETLGKMKAPAAIEPLIRSIQEKNSDLAGAARSALLEIGDAVIKPLLEKIKFPQTGIEDVAGEILVEMGRPAVDALINALPDRHTGKRVEEAVTKIGKPAVESLIRALRKRNIRAVATRVLGRIGDNRAVEPLIQELNKTDNRIGVAAALGNIGDTRAMGPLLQLLGDGSNREREAAAAALGELGDAGAVEGLIQVLEHDYTQRAAAVALGRIRDTRAVEPLIQVLNATGMTGDAVGEALTKIGEPAVAPLITSLEDEADLKSRRAAEVLARSGDSRVIVPLSHFLSSHYLIERVAKHIHASIDQNQIKGTLEDIQEINPYFHLVLSFHLREPITVAWIPKLMERMFVRPNSNQMERDVLNRLIPQSNLTELLITLTIRAAAYQITQTRGKHMREDFSFQEGIAATKRLCTINNPVSSNILYLITQRKSLSITLSICGDSVGKTINFKDQREIASEELKSRGFVTYQPEDFYN